jgi:hypothetical protein
MSAASDLSAAIAAAKRFKLDVEATLATRPLPPAATLNGASSAVASSTGQIKTLLTALEESTKVAAKKEQDAALSGLTGNLKKFTDQIAAAETRLKQLQAQGLT